MKFSIIVPLYNKAPYIRHALDSVAAQTYRDFELVIVNDGSTDGSLNIVNDFIREESGFKCAVYSQPNSGVAAARNNGVAVSNGEYVCFLDADDWWEPTFLEEMDRLIREYPEAGLYGMNYVYYKPGKTHVALHTKSGYINYPKEYLSNGAMMIFTSSSSSSRRVFDEMGGFPVGVKLGEDFLLWAKIALHYKVAFCEKPLAYYNNDVPASLRATRNLHALEHNMLFNMQDIESIVDSRERRDEWKTLLDKLRVNGLLDYWLDERYHDAAAAELAKVDWSRQPKNAKAQYEKPMWLLNAKRRFLQIGSFCKQSLIKLLHIS